MEGRETFCEAYSLHTFFSRYFLFAGFGLPALLVLTLLLTVGSETTPHGDKVDPNFQYGETQAYVALGVLVTCFLATAACMMLTQRWRQDRPVDQPNSGSTTSRRRRRDEAERHLLDATESEESDSQRSQPNYRTVEEHTGNIERR